MAGLSVGDIGIIEASTVRGEREVFAAVYAGRTWIVKTPRGVMGMVGVENVRLAFHVADDVSQATLTAFMVEAASQPFRWGECDCALSVANWCVKITGADPAAALRGAYKTEAGWRKLVDDVGGLDAMFERLAEAAGYERLVI